jgi:hypothetical protein
MYENDPWFRRRAGAGALLLLFVAAALALPLWYWRQLDHPLVGVASLDLCAPLRALPALSRFKAQPFDSPGSAGACRWHDDDDKLQLEAVLQTTRSSSGADFAKLFDTWRDEARLSYGPAAAMRQSGEPGERVLQYASGSGRQALLEDHGTLLFLSSASMDEMTLSALIEPVRNALRQASPPPR